MTKTVRCRNCSAFSIAQGKAPGKRFLRSEHAIRIDIIRFIVYNNCVAFCYFKMVMIMNIMSSADAAVKWNISRRRVEVLCTQGRIEGVRRMGGVWLIPEDAEKPADARVKSGKYIKSEKNGDKNEQ